MITLLITIIYLDVIFQKFIEKPREFTHIYRKYHYFHFHCHPCIHEHDFSPQNDFRPFLMMARGRRLSLSRAAGTITENGIFRSTAIAGKCGGQARLMNEGLPIEERGFADWGVCSDSPFSGLSCPPWLSFVSVGAIEPGGHAGPPLQTANRDYRHSGTCRNPERIWQARCGVSSAFGEVRIPTIKIDIGEAKPRIRAIPPSSVGIECRNDEQKQNHLPNFRAFRERPLRNP